MRELENVGDGRYTSSFVPLSPRYLFLYLSTPEVRSAKDQPSIQPSCSPTSLGVSAHKHPQA